EQERLPRVTQPSGQPGERGERAGYPRADHGGLRSDGEDIAGDGGERTYLAGDTADAEQPRDAEHSRGDEDDVLAADREDVVEAGDPEVLTHAVGERRIVAENDPLEDRAPLSPESGRDRAREVASQPIGEAAKSAAPADLAPRVDAGDDVEAVAAKPGAVIEAGRGPARLLDHDEGVDDRARRRSAAERQLQLNGLVDRPRRDPPQRAGGTNLEPPCPRLGGA